MPHPPQIDGFMLLRIRGTRVLMVVKAAKYKPDQDQAEWEAHQRYWVEEHTCPTNLVPVECIIDGTDHDPHGFLQFVAWKPKPDDFDEDDCNYDWSLMFKELSK